ncbi:MAG: type IV pilus biogenesis protein PilM, partial [Acidimicrobiales bacterium]
GEVADPGLVGAAIKRLWKQAKFSTKKVTLGVANQRVVVRPAEMPAMDDDELRTAIEFQADELIPLPLADAVLD